MHIIFSDPNLPPDQLVKGNLHKDLLGFSSWDLLVEPVVEVVSRGSMVQESEGGQSDEALHVESSSADEDLVDKTR
jgi:hypothetical protein